MTTLHEGKIVSADSPFVQLVGGPFLMHFADMVHLQSFIPQYSKDAAAPDAYTTWLIEGEIFYSLCCIKDPLSPEGATVMLLFDHAAGNLHYLRRDLWCMNCPEGTILLGHFIWDDIHGVKQPKFLLFDVVKWGGHSMLGECVKKRYELLRSLNLDDNSMISVQFVGEFHAVDKFVRDAQSGKIALPHQIKRAIVLTEDPFKPFYNKTAE